MTDGCEVRAVVFLFTLITPAAAVFVNTTWFLFDVPARPKPVRSNIRMLGRLVAPGLVLHPADHGVLILALAAKLTCKDPNLFSLGNGPSVLPTFVALGPRGSLEPGALALFALELPQFLLLAHRYRLCIWRLERKTVPVYISSCLFVRQTFY